MSKFYVRRQIDKHSGIFGDMLSLEDEVSAYLSLEGFYLSKNDIDRICRELNEQVSKKGPSVCFEFLYNLVKELTQKRENLNRKPRDYYQESLTRLCARYNMTMERALSYKAIAKEKGNKAARETLTQEEKAFFEKKKNKNLFT